MMKSCDDGAQKRQSAIGEIEGIDRCRNLIFGSLYSPTESEEADEAKRDEFWDGMHQAVIEIGCKERDIFLGIDNNGETGERDVSEDEVNDEEKEVKEEEERNLSRLLGKWGFGKKNENGKRLIEWCAANGWSMASSFFGLCQRKRSGLLMLHFMEGSTESTIILLVINW